MTNENLAADHEAVMEPQELARAIVDAIEDMKGENILLLDLREVTIIADFFVICTSTNERQAKAIVDRVSEKIKEQYRIRPWRTEGQANGGWILLDYADIVVHVFSEEMREYYDLEELWKDAKVLLRIQ